MTPAGIPSYCTSLRQLKKHLIQSIPENTPNLPAVVVDGSGAQPTRLQLDDLEFATELGPDGQGIDKFSRSGPNDS